MNDFREIRHFHLACGLGGGAKGFNRGQARVGNMKAKFRCIGGIDIDPAAIRDFGKLAGVPGTVMDLFNRRQYIGFHGKEPPADWREATPQDVHRAAGGERPHIVFASFPCKGFSGLLSEAKSKTGKYQALNELALRGVWLMLEAWKDDPVELFVFENVPRIANRGRHLLDQMTQLLQGHGYAIAETTHDCGELGGLAQSRKRFLLVARHMAKVPAYLYEPEKKPLRAVGDVLGRMPMPGHPSAGPMHRMPSLQWKTWVRLAFVEAGKDWRSLQGLRVEDGMLTDFGIMPARECYAGAYGVNLWGDHTGTVTSRGGPSNGTFAVADPMHRQSAEYGQLGVRKWESHTGAVSGQSLVGGGAYAVQDIRIPNVLYNHAFKIVRWNQPADVVNGSGGHVADPRVDGATASHGNVKVTEWDGHAGAITTQRSPGAGAGCVADPRVGYGDGSHRNKLSVIKWADKSGTVTGASQVQGGALSVADPRTGFGPATHHNVLHVTGWDAHSKTISGANHPSGGALGVADPRAPEGSYAGKGKYRVTGYDEHTGVVISGSTTGQGAFAVADPNPALLRVKGDHYLTGGHYGVIRWGDTAFTVSGSASLDNGWNSVGDPRPASAIPDAAFAEPDLDPEKFRLPEASQRLVCVIRALDGTWHRPFTTLELAAIQSLIDPEDHLELEGLSDSAWRERIGNAVPPEAAEAIASVFGKTLLMAWAGETFTLSAEPIWVRPIALALAVDVPAIRI